MSGLSEWHEAQANQTRTDIQNLSPSAFGGSEYWRLQNSLNSNNVSLELERSRAGHFEELISRPISFTTPNYPNVDYSLARTHDRHGPESPPLDIKAFFENAVVVFGSLLILAFSCAIFAAIISLTPKAPDISTPFVETYIKRGANADLD